MYHTLAQTEWPSLGDIFWQYLTTNESIIYTPHLCVVGIVIMSAVISWTIANDMPTLVIKDVELHALRANTITKLPASLFVLYAVAHGVLDPMEIAIWVTASCCIIEALIYWYACPEVNFSLELIICTLLSNICCAICAWLIMSYGFFCLLALAIGVITAIKLINDDKLRAMELLWVLVPAILGLFGEQ